MTDYDLAFGFWRLLAQSYTPLGKGKALVNTAAPLVFSNALWYPEPESIAELSDFYGEQGVSGSCVLSVTLDEGLLKTSALSNAGFSRTVQYGLNRISTAAPVSAAPVSTDLNVGPTVEQVSWSQTRALGEVIAAAYDLGPYAVAVGQSLALALQLESNLGAFVAYDGALDNEAVGAMVTLEGENALTAFVLEALTDEAASSLNIRLAFEAQTRHKEAWVFSPSETGGLELWSRTCS